MGNALFDLGRLDEAGASYARALELDADSVDAQIALAKVLRQTGRVAEAEQSSHRALQIAPNCAEALALLGEIQADRGRFTDAETLFGRSLAISPGHAEAWAGLARYRKMGAGDADWLAAARRLVGGPLPIGQEINLRYAIGKYFDDVQDFGNAFDSYRLANELQKRGGVPHDRQRLTARVEQIRGFFDREWLGNARAQGNESLAAGIHRRHAAFRNHADRANSRFAPTGIRRRRIALLAYCDGEF